MVVIDGSEFTRALGWSWHWTEVSAMRGHAAEAQRRAAVVLDGRRGDLQLEGSVRTCIDGMPALLTG